MSANDEQRDLLFELRVGPFAAILLSVLAATTCLLAPCFYFPTREDKLWEAHSRTALPRRAQPLDDSTVLSLNRTTASCLDCPQYRVRLFGSGKVEYVGEQFVCAFGEREGSADPREVRHLVEAMVATGYFGFEFSSAAYRMDHPSATSILRHGGQSYQLQDYYGDRGAPRWVRAMESEIDRVAGTARWLPDPTRRCPDPAGGTRLVTMREPIEDALRRIIHPTIVPSQIKLLPLPHDEPDYDL